MCNDIGFSNFLIAVNVSWCYANVSILPAYSPLPKIRRTLLDNGEPVAAADIIDASPRCK